MASFVGSSSAWGTSMDYGTTGHTIPVFVPSEIFQGNSVPPFRVGDVLSVVLVFISERDPALPEWTLFPSQYDRNGAGIR